MIFKDAESSPVLRNLKHISFSFLQVYVVEENENGLPKYFLIFRWTGQQCMPRPNMATAFHIGYLDHRCMLEISFSYKRELEKTLPIILDVWDLIFVNVDGQKLKDDDL